MTMIAPALKKQIYSVFLILSSSNLFAEPYSWRMSADNYFGTMPDCGAKFSSISQLAACVASATRVPNTSYVGYRPANQTTGWIDFQWSSNGQTYFQEGNVVYVRLGDGCPAGQHLDAQNSQCVAEEKDLGDSGCPNTAGTNPINIGIGNKFQREIDYAFGNITLERFYNSQGTGKSTSWGVGWTGTYDRSIFLGNASGVAKIIRPDGKVYTFTFVNNAWESDEDVFDQLSKETNPAGVFIGWSYRAFASGDTEFYNTAGQLTRIVSHNGYTRDLIYSDGSTGVNGGYVLNSDGTATANRLPKGLLIRLTDSFGRQLVFGYDTYSRAIRFVDPTGGIYRYSYDAANNLSSISYPDSKVRSYRYNEPANNASPNSPNNLTGIIDENNSRFATYKYDSLGRAISSEHNLANGQPVKKSSIVYSVDSSGNVTASAVTDALNTTRTYSFSKILGIAKSTSATQPCTSGCGTASTTTYDASGNIASKTDFNGNKTCYAYDLTRNLETQRVEGLASSANCASALSSLPANSRQIKTQWHPTSRLENKRAEPKRLTTFVYNGQPDPAGGTASCAPASAQVNGLPIAVLCKKIEQATTDTTGATGFSAVVTGTPRTWTYTYNALGQVLTTNGPRTDVNDVTTYTYYPSSSNTAGSVHAIGDLATVTNTAGHVTSITNYDLNGRPLSITDANGVITTLTYTPRGWLKTKTVNGVQTTTYDYDGVGQLTQITLPDNSALKYTYDTAHRLTDIENGYVVGGVLTLSGNKIHYTLDAMGNRTQEDTRDASVIRKTQSRVFNSLNQLWRDIGGTSPSTQITEYSYDNNGNLKTITNPNGVVTQNGYDAFNRLLTVTTDLNNPTLTSHGVTTYGYDGLNQTTQVKDPRLVTTDYTVDGLGNVTLTQSPDSGNTTKVYDAAGNVTQKTDARSIVSNYTYDALNRLSSIEYPSDPASSAYFYYDNPNFYYSRGRLNIIEYGNTGSLLVFTHDAYGNLKSQTDWVTFSSGDQKQFASSYLYDNANRLQRINHGITGRRTIYTRNALGQITQVQTQDNANAPLVAVVSNITYQPFGPIKNLEFGNGVTTAIQHDADYRIARITATANPIWDFEYSYDNTGNVVSMFDLGDETLESKSYAYDNLDRVISDYTWLGYLYGYDAGGNRLKREQWPYTPMTQQYAANSNRETSYNGSAMSSDSVGNITQRSNLSLSYNAANQLLQSTRNSVTTTYQYNALGWRNSKQNSALTHYDYLPDGKLLAQVKLNADNTHNQVIEYLWLDDLPIAQIKTTYAANNVVSTRRLTYIHADHLNTPRIMTDNTKNVVWKWHSDAYGMINPNGNPDGDSVSDPLDLRFPGQIYDSESGLYYNMYRYYDPMLGRYTQSDPIGLQGGLNTYGYVDGNPVSFTDPLGLAPAPARVVDPTGLGGGGGGQAVVNGIGIGLGIGVGGAMESRGRGQEDSKSKREPCNATDLDYCAAKCGGRHKVNACYVQVTWKFKQWTPQGLLERENRSVECDCDDECH